MSTASHDPSDPPASAGGPEGADQDLDQDVRPISRAHLSFVQRLRQRYGREVDPRITLQDQSEEEGGREAREGDSSSPSSSSRGLYRKLSQQPTIGPTYRVIKEIARGGMGTVLRVWDDDLRRNMAMKVMLGPEGEDEGDTPRVDDEKLGRFLEEAQITGQLDHPGIVPVHSLGIDERGRIYFTMRLVRGRELKEILDLARKGEEGWTLTKALNLILKVCEAMAFAHSKGVVHRDLKPANVMVGRFGETYVMDWGLARVMGRRDTHDLRLKPAEDPSAVSLVRTVRKDESLSNPDSPLMTMDGDVVGTPSFMAPEQAQGRLEDVGPRSDVYSLGAILYYMLTGRAPYVRPGERVSPHIVLTRVLEGPPVPVGKLAKDAPSELVAICEKAMAHDATTRYGSMLEVAEDIQAFLEGRVVRAYEGGAVAEFKKWVVRNRSMAAALAAMALIVLASAVGFAVQKSRQFTSIQKEQARTEEARKEAIGNLQKAESNARKAQENLELALDRKEEADRNAAIALQNAMLASASGYMANVIAAEFSLRLHEVAEARQRLNECDPDLRSWEWRHLDLRTHMALRSFDLPVDDVAFGADSRSFVSVSRWGKVRVVDAETGAPLPPEQMIFGLSASFQSLPTERGLDVRDDGGAVLVFGIDQIARVFDLVTGERLLDVPADSSVPGHGARVTAGAFSPDGRLVATGAADGTLLLWDAATGALVRALLGSASPVSALAWSPDSAELASAHEDDTLKVWSVTTGEQYTLRGHQDDVLAVAWSPDGRRIASGGADHAVILWSARGSQRGVLERILYGHDQAVRAVDFHPREGLLLSASDDTTLRLWALEDPGSVVLHGHLGPVRQAAFSPDGRLIVTGSTDGTTKLWDAAGDPSTTVLEGAGAAVLCAAYHPDSRRVVTGHENDRLVVWDGLSGEILQILAGHESAVGSVAISRDGTTVLSGSGDKTARLWDIESGRELLAIPHEKGVGPVAIGPDGSWIATGASDGVVRVFDARSGELLHTLPGQRRWLNAIAVSPDGTLIAAGGHDRMISVWRDFAPDAFLELATDERSGTIDLAFGPDGRLYSANISDHAARAWDLQAGAESLVLRGHEGTVTSIAVSADGTRVVTGAEDETVRVWDAFSGGSLLVLRGNQETNITDVGFSADGKRVLASFMDMTARIWESGDVEARRAARQRARELRQAAEPLVERLFADHFFLEDVELNLRAMPRLDEDLRATALRLARLQGDDPALLDRLTREVVLSPGLDPQSYQAALRRALAACSLDREHPWLLATLGMAQYRAGEHAAAIETLRSALELDEENAGNLRPARAREAPFDDEETVLVLSFLAMAQHHAGEAETAAKSLADACDRGRRASLRESGTPVAAALTEAETLVNGAPSEG